MVCKEINSTSILLEFYCLGRYKHVCMCVPTSVSCGAPEDDDVNRPDLGIESWASGYAITRGYGGFWVFEALLNASWVWVFLGMGTQKNKCQSVGTLHTFIQQGIRACMHEMPAFFSQTA